MGKRSRWFRVGMLLVLFMLGLCVFYRPVGGLLADDDEDDSSGNGHWEGIALARLDHNVTPR